MDLRHPLNSALRAALLLTGLASTSIGAAPNSVSGEGQDVQILNAYTDANPVVAGSNLRYTVLAFVNGAGPVANLTITLPMPAGTGLVSAEGPGGGTCNAPAPGANGNISCSWPVTAGTIINSRVLAAVISVPPATPTGTLLSSTISAAADEGDPNTANNAWTLQTTVIAAGDLHVSVPAMGVGALILLSLMFGLSGMMAAGRRQA